MNTAADPCRYYTTDSSIEYRNSHIWYAAMPRGPQPKFREEFMNGFKPALFDDHAQAIAKRQYMQPSDGDIYALVCYLTLPPGM